MQITQVRPGRKSGFSNEEILSIISRRDSGETFTAIAESMNSNPCTVRTAYVAGLRTDRDPSTFVVPEDCRRIPGFSFYFARSDGEIVSMRQGNIPRVMAKVSTNSHKVFLVNDLGEGVTRQVHDLVCMAFHGERPDAKSVVVNLDGDRLNNKSTNLQWSNDSTPPELIIRRGRPRLDRETALAIYRANNIDGIPVHDLAREYDLHPSTVYMITRATGRWKDIGDIARQAVITAIQ